MDVVWHPIKSGADLPTQSGEYLVTIYDSSVDARYVRIADYDAEDVMWIERGWQAGTPAAWAWEGESWMWRRVTAWRPLPKPYEGGA